MPVIMDRKQQNVLANAVTLSPTLAVVCSLYNTCPYERIGLAGPQAYLLAAAA